MIGWKIAGWAAIFWVAIPMAAANKNVALRLKVLDIETHSVAIDDSGVPKNCDGLNYDAYCHGSKSAQVTHELLVQQDSQAPFWVACNVESKWSHCDTLPVGATYDARVEKHGITIYYEDDDGKARKQLYTLVDPSEKLPIVPPAVEGQASIPAKAATSPLLVGAQSIVKCSFTSNPAGAEITVDGQYVGSTPSEVGLPAGKHTVVISMPGFGTWKRELAIATQSNLTVNAVLEKSK